MDKETCIQRPADNAARVPVLLPFAERILRAVVKTLRMNGRFRSKLTF